MTIRAEILPDDLPLPDLLDETGRLKLLPASAYDALPRDALRVWCHQHARYGLPTVELVDWLKAFIGDRKAIEIGSGHGDLAYHLGIPATDSYIQRKPDVAAVYRATGQPIVQYPKFVERLEALDAIARHKPDVVVASWVTHWIDPNLPPPPGGGSIYGVREDALLYTGVTYVLVGNLAVHGQKKIRMFKHDVLELPFIRSRASDPSLDRVFVWNNR